MSSLGDFRRITNGRVRHLESALSKMFLLSFSDSNTWEQRAKFLALNERVSETTFSNSSTYEVRPIMRSNRITITDWLQSSRIPREIFKLY